MSRAQSDSCSALHWRGCPPKKRHSDSKLTGIRSFVRRKDRPSTATLGLTQSTILRTLTRGPCKLGGERGIITVRERPDGRRASLRGDELHDYFGASTAPKTNTTNTWSLSLVRVGFALSAPQRRSPFVTAGANGLTGQRSRMFVRRAVRRSRHDAPRVTRPR